MTTFVGEPIWVTALRNALRLARITIYPRWITDRPRHPAVYDTARARQLLASTGEIPTTKAGLLATLAEYRQAVHDLTQAADPRPHDAPQPTS